MKVRNVWHIVRAVLILWMFLQVGLWMVDIAHLPLPGSIVGMLLFFIALSSKILPEEWVGSLCSILLRYMVLLFIPVSVGVMNYFDWIIAYWRPLLVSVTVSSLMVLVLVGSLMEHFENRQIVRPLFNKWKRK